MEETEELVDFYVHRRLARPIARALQPTRVSPNGVTIGGAVLGLAAGAALWNSGENPPLRLAAAVLLFASVVLDCTDGQLARLRNQASRAGVILDGLADSTVGFVAMAAAAHLLTRPYPGWPIWILTAVAMASSQAQCFLFDVAKERYVAARRLAYAPSKLLMSERVRETAQSGPDISGEHSVLTGIFNRYAAVVAKLAGTADRSIAPPLLPLERGHLRAWATIGVGTHFACLYAAAAISSVWLPALLVCLLIFSTVMNVVLAALLWLRPMRFS